MMVAVAGTPQLSLCSHRRKSGLTHRSRKSRKNRARTVRIDTLLLAKYGIIQPTKCPEGMTVMTPISELTSEDREDLYDFAHFLMAPERAHDFDFLNEEAGEEELVRDED